MEKIKIRKKPFLVGNMVKVIVNGERYHVKCKKYDELDAIEYAKKVLTNHDKRMGDLELKAKAW